jgi:AcrR family transcriptional regulator
MRIAPYTVSPFVAPTSMNNADLLTDAAYQVLATVGVDRLSMGAVARNLRMTSSAVSQRAGSRAQFVEIVVVRFGGRWRRWVEAPVTFDELPARLPVDELERHGVVVWRALRELARGEALAGRPAAIEAIRSVDAAERVRLSGELRRRLGRTPTEDEVDGLLALLDGVRGRMVDRASPLPLEQARAVVLRYVTLLPR